MTRSRIVIGFLSIPMLAAGLTAWLSMGDVEAVGQIAQHPACDPAKTGCPPGACCGDIIGMINGCAAASCCGNPSDLYCDSSQARIPEQWPQLRIDGSGRCLMAQGDPVLKCTTKDCDGSTFCSASDCHLGGVEYESLQQWIVEGAVCPHQQN